MIWTLVKSGARKVFQSRTAWSALSALLTVGLIYAQGRSAGVHDCAQASADASQRDSATAVELANNRRDSADRTLATELEIEDAYNELAQVLSEERDGLAACGLSDDGRLRINRALARIAGTD